MSLDPLWQPIEIGPVQLKNRVVLTAHAINASPDNIMGQRSFDYYEERARGGVGLIITEAQIVHRSGKGGLLTVQEGWLPESAAAYEQLAEVAHRHGAKVFCELAHMGPVDHNMLFLDNYRALHSPSGLAPLNNSENPRPMEDEDFAALIEGFVKTARNAQSAGLDGVEIHAAHGFLLATFLSPATNKRTDRYGGSTENRCRFVVEIAEAVREEIGADYPLGLRFSFDEFLPDGVDEEEGERILRVFQRTGLFDYFSVSGGATLSVSKQVSPMAEPPGQLQPFAAQAKEILGADVPVLTVNQIGSVEQAAEIVGSGVADLVAMVRAHMADPHIVAKAQAGEADEIRPCVYCNQGCLSRLYKQQALTCTVNPVAGREAEWGHGTLEPAERALRIAIVGAGPAGLKAAEVAAERGHEVSVFDRADEIGGNVRHAARLPYRERWADLTGYFEHRLERLGVEVRLGAEVSAADVLALDPDAVVLATGAKFDKDGFSSALGFRPGIPGLDNTTVLTPVEAIEEPDRAGENVLIADDTVDYMPLGLAELLADAGKQVEVVSAQMIVGADTLMTADVGLVYPRLHGKDVKITPQHFVGEVGDGEATISSVWGGPERTVELDSIVVNMARTPELGLYEELADGLGRENVHRIGDCSAPRRIDEAIYEGEKIGRAL